MWGRSQSLADVSHSEARVLYNQNWDGCRESWKALYRQSREKRLTEQLEAFAARKANNWKTHR